MKNTNKKTDVNKKLAQHSAATKISREDTENCSGGIIGDQSKTVWYRFPTAELNTPGDGDLEHVVAHVENELGGFVDITTARSTSAGYTFLQITLPSDNIFRNIEVNEERLFKSPSFASFEESR